MAKEYRYNKEDNFKYLFKIILELLFWYVLIIGIIFFTKEKNIEALKLTSLLFAIIMMILSVLPLLLLFFNHKKHSKSVVLKVDFEEMKFTFNDANRSIDFQTDNIEKVILNLSPSSFENWIDFLFFGIYYYAIIKFKDKDCIVISCLVCDEIEKIFPEELIEKVKKPIPLIRYSSVK